MTLHISAFSGCPSVASGFRYVDVIIYSQLEVGYFHWLLLLYWTINGGIQGMADHSVMMCKYYMSKVSLQH